MKRSLIVSIGACVVFASGGLVEAEIVYGTAKLGYYDPGDIYRIDTIFQTAALLVDISETPVAPSGSPPIAPLAGDSPNGNAFDTASRRLYFVSFQDPGSPASGSVAPSELYYVDILDTSSIVWAGTLAGHASGAAFHEGKYWYISHGTNELRSVSLNADGTMASEALHVIVQHNDPGFLIFGDISFDPAGSMYLTGAVKDQSTGFKRYLSGTVDLSTGAFTEIGQSLYWGQIAFGADGALYGHDAVTGDFCTVNVADGTANYLFTEGAFTDLAPCPVCGCIAGDLHPDGRVDFLDYAVFAEAVSSGAGIDSADFDENGRIDMYDLMVLAGNWLETVCDGK